MIKNFRSPVILAAAAVVGGGLMLGCETNSSNHPRTVGPNPGDDGIRDTTAEAGLAADKPLTPEEQRALEEVPDGAGRPGATVHGATGMGDSTVPAGVGQTGSSGVRTDDLDAAQGAAARDEVDTLDDVDIDDDQQQRVAPGWDDDDDITVFDRDTLDRLNNARTEQEREAILREARQRRQQQQQRQQELREQEIQRQQVPDPGAVGNPADPQGTGQTGDPGAPGSPTPSGQTGTPD